MTWTRQLLRFTWFDAAVRKVSYQIATPPAVAAFRQAARTYRMHVF